MHHTDGTEWRLYAGRFKQTVVGLVCGISLIGQMLAVSDYAVTVKQNDDEPSKAAAHTCRVHAIRRRRFGDRSVVTCMAGGLSLGKMHGAFTQ